METAYDKAIEATKKQFFGFGFTEIEKGRCFELEGEYFTITFDTRLEDVMLNVHEKTDVIAECLMEELAEMNCTMDDLRPFMRQIVAQHFLDNQES